MSDPTGRAPSVARWESFGRLSSGVSGAEDGGVLSGEPDSDAMVSGGDDEDNVTWRRGDDEDTGRTRSTN